MEQKNGFRQRKNDIPVPNVGSACSGAANSVPTASLPSMWTRSGVHIARREITVVMSGVGSGSQTVNTVPSPTALAT
jgi:hypothetical protein